MYKFNDVNYALKKLSYKDWLEVGEILKPVFLPLINIAVNKTAPAPDEFNLQGEAVLKLFNKILIDETNKPFALEDIDEADLETIGTVIAEFSEKKIPLIKNIIVSLADSIQQLGAPSKNTKG